MPFSTLPSFGKVAKKVATFSLLPNFGNYIRNPAKILVTCQNFGNYAKFWHKVFFGIKVNRPIMSLLFFLATKVCDSENNTTIHIAVYFWLKDKLYQILS